MSGPSADKLAQGWSKDLADCVPKLITAYPIVAAKFMATNVGFWMRNDYTWRSAQFQHSLFEKGRTLVNGAWLLTNPALKVTNSDGVSKPSLHQTYPSCALDFIIFKGTKPIWSTGRDPEAQRMYAEVGRLFESHGIKSGAFWKPWADPGHVQVS